ncbi:inorganic triphosphatase [Mesorhizobium sp. M4B.F.Ca.ET.190.01.1.1]|uniref:CYTH and CHAD domain-containing protein n=1 Tax=unclassified Mesorhizobium TaxID=325217 RepID=UPI00109283CC|nr:MULTISPECIES: inorganic triphosphatase [unclassified Mesorhizobium]TGR00950.1 inorganic triphosphatase [Mesorhizobium sp. M4B.F.Ca.ET.200.01.1.1]TGS12667.1 inorganic triphosphatase [Mesorhizobium sp. M4B.F.Ca.ET.190.01.1.1]TGT25292.1 inorganic triphosphatase [Mesorhizobium sp. M4B.F.Ca.ET.172.01.1.1]
MQETELKLELSQTGARSLLKKNPFGSSPTVLQQISIYFDTPGWDLSMRGLSLRIRQSGNERIQTVKAGDGAAAGSFTREEWERPVPGDRPILDDPQIRDLLAEAGPELAPLFEVHVKRHSWTVIDGDATIEVALDIGKVVAADREAPLCEIEFEKKAGSARALFALARKVDLLTPTHVGVLSKAERGYHLLGSAPGAVKAASSPLTSEMSATTGFAHIAAACLRQFRLNENGAGLVPRCRGPASGRVSLRRLRSLCSICKSLFHDSRFDYLREELKWLASEFGDARNIDVMIGRASSEALSSCLQNARDDAYAAVEASLSSVRTRSLMIEATEWVSLRDWRTDQSDETLADQSARDFACGIFDKFWKKVAKGGKNLVDADDETRHKLRIAAKKLSYAAEFFEPLYKSKAEAKRHRRFIKAMEDLQDQLGSLNDLATAPDMLAALELSDVAGAKDLYSADDKSKLLKDAAEAHDALVDSRRFWR